MNFHASDDSRVFLGLLNSRIFKSLLGVPCIASSLDALKTRFPYAMQNSFGSVGNQNYILWDVTFPHFGFKSTFLHFSPNIKPCLLIWGKVPKQSTLQDLNNQ